MEACKAVAEVVHRQLDAIPALKEMLAELPPADHVDDGGLGGNDGGGSRVAIEAIREMTDEVARTGDFHHLLGAVVVAHRVLETACLDVTKQAGAPPSASMVWPAANAVGSPWRRQKSRRWVRA